MPTWIWIVGSVVVLTAAVVVWWLVAVLRETIGWLVLFLVCPELALLAALLNGGKGCDRHHG